MNLLTRTALSTYSSANADGTPRAWDSSAILEYHRGIERVVLSALVGQFGVYGTESDLQGNLTPEENAGAWVIGDADPNKDGLYRKVGAGGTGSWYQVFQGLPGAVDIDQSIDHRGSYSALTTYNQYEVVTGSDGKWYSLQSIQSTGLDPVGDGSGAWIEIADFSAQIPLNTITDADFTSSGLMVTDGAGGYSTVTEGVGVLTRSAVGAYSFEPTTSDGGYQFDATKYGAVPDCTGQGIGTDAMPAIAAAFNAGLAAYPDGGFTVYLPSGRYRIASQHLFDLNNARNVDFVFKGSLTIDDVAMWCFQFQNGGEMTFEAFFFEGGRFQGWSAALPFYTDYATVADVVVNGGQEAIVLNGIKNFTAAIEAYGYAGRVLHIYGVSSTSSQYQGGLRGTVKCFRDNDLSKARVAQSIYAEHGNSDIGTGYAITLESLTEDFSYYGPQFIGINDVVIDTIDAAYAKSGPQFKGCGVVIGDNWYVGDIDDDPSGYHVIFTSYFGNKTSFIDIKQMKFLNGGNGLLMYQVEECRIDEVHHIGSAIAFADIVHLTESKNVEMGIRATGSGSSLAYVSGSTTENVTLKVQASTAPSSNAVVLDTTIPNDAKIRISGDLNVADGFSGVLIQSNAHVLLNGLDGQGLTGALLNITASNNKVKYLDGIVRDGIVQMAGAAPLYVDPSIT